MNLLIIDLEATCWKEKSIKKKSSEIIEIGACIIDKHNEILSEFQSFVRPIRCPTLSDFCKELTHIKQEEIDNACDFSVVISKFIDWIQPCNIYVWGSWGKYDFNQILLDCYYHQVLFPFFAHLNLKNVIATHLGIKPKGVSNMLDYLGLEFEGTQHRALEDVRNIVRIAKKASYQFRI